MSSVGYIGANTRVVCQTVSQMAHYFSNSFQKLKALSTEPYVALAYSELCQIFIKENFIQNHVYPQHILNPDISRVQVIFIILLNICNEKCYSKTCVTLTYSEPQYIHNSGLFRNQSIFRTLSISKMEHFIKNPV